ncbi:hypothetical protein D3C84_813640 [compost metagenome]
MVWIRSSTGSTTRSTEGARPASTPRGMATTSASTVAVSTRASVLTVSGHKPMMSQNTRARPVRIAKRTPTTRQPIRAMARATR